MSAGIIDSAILQCAKPRRYVIAGDAMESLRQYVKTSLTDKIDVKSVKDVVTPIFTHIRDNNEKLENNKITDPVVKQAIKEMQQLNTNQPSAFTLSHRNAVQVINAFDVPQFKYNMERKVFERSIKDDKNSTIFAEGRQKNEVLRDRYLLLKQIMLRNEKFNPLRQDSFTITAIEALTGTSSLKIIMGMIVQREVGKFYLEDLTAAVQVDLSEADTNKIGLLTEGSIVIANGIFNSDDRIYKVSAIVLCEPEPREISIKTINQGRNDRLDLFGVRNNNISLDSEATKNQEEFTKDSCFFVTLSDVWLDQPSVLERLRSLFRYFVEDKHKEQSQTLDRWPCAIVLIGSFVSKPMHTHSFGENGDQSMYKKRFNELAEMLLKEFPLLVDDDSPEKIAPMFVFVPGPNDPCPGPPLVYPRPPISTMFYKSFQEKIPNSIFISNPCRVRIYNSEIVLFRDDLQQKMHRNTVLDQKLASNPLSEHVTNTLIYNSHLTPLPISIQPIYWSHDHAMRLYPTPNVLVLAENNERYENEQNSCKCFNPGSFHVDSRFVICRPLVGDVKYVVAELGQEE
ncbi:DNA polymerase epsilon subunit 2 [Acrasis kona]|uniref:DNA polymerase epsilon subunit n=1 Tax=Acrasis kona TaxID=1008807 RepID=A0AAW2ZL48_9EUKA